MHPIASDLRPNPFMLKEHHELMINQTLFETRAERPATLDTGTPRRTTALIILSGLWLILFFAALFTPPLLDDADATHANAARHMALTGDLVTLHVDGIRYLEKAPLPYWLVALSFRIFGFNTFAAHLPQAIGRSPPRAPRLPLGRQSLQSPHCLLHRPRHPHLRRSLPLHPLLHPRSPALPLPLHCPLLPPPVHRIRNHHKSACPIFSALFAAKVGIRARREPYSFPRHLRLPHVDSPRPRRPHQRPRSPRLLLRHRDRLPGPHRRIQKLARPETLHRQSPLPRHRRSLAHPRRPAQHRRHERPRLLLVLLRQRALPPLPRQALSRWTTTSSPAISSGASTSSGSSPGRSSAESSTARPPSASAASTRPILSPTVSLTGNPSPS